MMRIEFLTVHVENINMNTRLLNQITVIGIVDIRVRLPTSIETLDMLSRELIVSMPSR